MTEKKVQTVEEARLEVEAWVERERGSAREFFQRDLAAFEAVVRADERAKS